MGQSYSIVVSGYGYTLDEAMCSLKAQLQAEHNIDLVQNNYGYLGVEHGGKFYGVVQNKINTRWGQRWRVRVQVQK